MNLSNFNGLACIKVSQFEHGGLLLETKFFNWNGGDAIDKELVENLSRLMIQAWMNWS